MTVSRFLFFLYLNILFSTPWVARAGGTRIWEMAGFEELEKGELKGTTLSSRGVVSVGLDTTKIDMDEVGVVWSAVADKNGDIYLGTGYDGKIYRKRGKAVSLVAETKQLVVTALALDNQGSLYIAALPDAVILRLDQPSRITKPVEPVKWATLPKEAEHVFSLAFSRDHRTLFVGSGPNGTVFAIGRDKKPQVYLETDEEHILCLGLDDKGNLLAGTSPSSRLLRITGPGRAVALADFDATEVKAVITGNGRVFAAVNEFKSPPKVPSKIGLSTTSTTKSSSVVGDGSLYAIDSVGRQELLWKEKKSHVIALALDKHGKLYAGLGTDGKIISIDTDRLVRTELDLDERQVMSLVTRDSLEFAGTGDAGAAYSVFKARPQDAVYLSPLLEAETVATFGRIDWLADGRVSVQTRSGNTITPDKRWSDWQRVPQNGGPIPSPPARYLQLRFTFADAANGSVISAQVAFKPQNRRAIITEMDPGSPFPKPSSSDENLSERTIAARPDVESDPEISLKWKVDNPDDDDLRYRLWYKEVSADLWRPILKDDQVLESTRYTWDTISVPEGTYQIKLTAEDSIQNDPREVLTDTFISVPIVIDNQPPKVRNLSIKNGRLSGTAEDGCSKIGAVELSIDNGPWIPVFPKDGIYDEKQESFDMPMPETKPEGPHAAAVRTFDRRGNMGIAEALFDTK